MGRVRSLIFLDLPDQSSYPYAPPLVSTHPFRDYYKFIQQPISMNMIKEKLNSYSHPLQFYQDFMLLFANAKRYNAEGIQRT